MRPYCSAPPSGGGGCAGAAGPPAATALPLPPHTSIIAGGMQIWQPSVGVPLPWFVPPAGEGGASLLAGVLCKYPCTCKVTGMQRTFARLLYRLPPTFFPLAPSDIVGKRRVGDQHTTRAVISCAARHSASGSTLCPAVPAPQHVAQCRGRGSYRFPPIFVSAVSDRPAQPHCSRGRVVARSSNGDQGGWAGGEAAGHLEQSRGAKGELMLLPRMRGSARTLGGALPLPPPVQALVPPSTSAQSSHARFFASVCIECRQSCSGPPR